MATPPAGSFTGSTFSMDTPVAAPRSPEGFGTPLSSQSNHSSRAGSPMMHQNQGRFPQAQSARSHNLQHTQIVPANEEEVRRFLTQCDSRALILETSNSSTQLIEAKLPKETISAEQFDGEVERTRYIRSFPGFPILRGPVLRFSPNSRQNSLLVATANELVICHLSPRDIANGSSNIQAGRLNGTLKRMSDEGEWDLQVSGHTAFGSSSFAKLDLMGTLVDGQLTGKVKVEGDELEGEFWCTQNQYPDDDVPIIPKATWSGSCSLERHANLANDFPISFKVVSLEAKDENSFAICLDIGSVGVELIDYTTLGTSNTHLVDAQWHPLLKDNIVTLDARGNVRVYDLGSKLDSAIWTGSVLQNSMRNQQCVAMCFGRSPGHPLNMHKPSTQSSLQLQRQLALFILLDSGAIISLGPVGKYTSKVPEIKALHKVLAAETSLEDNATKTLKAWVDAIMQNKPFVMNPIPVLQCPAPQHNDTPAGASHGSRACGLSYLPVEGSAAAVFLRTWKCGRVDTLLGGLPVLLRMQEGNPGQDNNGDSNSYSVPRLLPRQDSNVVRPQTLDQGPKRSQRRTDNFKARDSPLRALGQKMSAAYSQSRAAQGRGDADSVVQALRFDDLEEDHESGSNAISSPMPSHRLSVQNIQRTAQELITNPRPPTLVGCTQLGKETSLVLERDLIRVDIVVGKDSRGGGNIYLLWLPWLNDLCQGKPFDPSRVSKLLCRAVPGIILPCGPASGTLFVEPGVGHLALAVTLGPNISIQNHDIGNELVKLSSAFGGGDVMELINSNDEPSHAGLLRDSGDGEQEENDMVDSARELDELRLQLSQQLSRLTTIPRKLQSVKLMSPDTPPALSLAICSWLHELSETLLYGHAKSSSRGLMECIRIGMSQVALARKDQVDKFQHQVEQVRKIQESLNKTRDNLERLSKGQISRLLELQALLEESFECLQQQIASIAPQSTPHDRQILLAYTDLEAKAEELAQSIGDKDRHNGSILPNFMSLLAKEESLMRRSHPEDCLKENRAVLEGVQNLQAQTQDLVAHMMEPEGNHERVSALSLQERIWKVRQRIQAIAGSGIFVGAPVILLGFQAEPIRKLQNALQDGKITEVRMERGLLQRPYQAGIRRLISADGVDFPFALPTDPQRPTASAIHLILLAEGVYVDFQHENCDESGWCVLRANPQYYNPPGDLDQNDDDLGEGNPVESENRKSSNIEVTLVDILGHDAEASARKRLTGLYVYEDNESLKSACKELVNLAKLHTSKTVRVIGLK